MLALRFSGSVLWNLSFLEIKDLLCEGLTQTPDKEATKGTV